MSLDSIKDEYIEVYLKFGNWEKEVADLALSRYPNLPLYFENLFGFYYKSLFLISMKDLIQFPNWQRNCLLFYAKTLRTIYSAQDLSYKGCYLESMASTRIIFESFIRIAFLVCFPEKEDEVFQDKFKIANATKILDINIYNTYQLLSNFTHSHKVEMTLELFTILKGDRDNTPVRPVFNEDFFTSTFNMLLFCLWTLVAILPEVFPSLQSASKWKTEQEFLMEEAGKYFLTHEKEKWKEDANQILLLKKKMQKAR
ncbi:MAG: hypothetical protein O2999_08320 [Nitrospirae bacterium]|nr:hypothetical protein [Nitrospirota bacterium]MDA1304291.1 hypothetical protein [Nitrospirota bacterium]